MDMAFLIGSPRSGTTVLENILHCHGGIAAFYEPYYLWERYFKVDTHDVWDENDLNQKVISGIRKEFCIFAKKSGKPIVLDKSPVHAYNIAIILKIFPDARWIHIVRDGRDATLSIHREWEKRRLMVEKKDYVSLLKTAKAMVDRQPFLRFRLQAIFHEILHTASVNPRAYLNKSRWKGKSGWGPRFADWEQYLNRHPVILFNAMQWASCVTAAHSRWGMIPSDKKIEVHYETLLTDPENTISHILQFLGCRTSSAFYSRVPALKPDNFNKWKKQLTKDQLELILPVLSPMLKAYGYAS